MVESLPLKAMHLPEAAGFWPLAPGWWLIVALLVLILIAATLLNLRRRRRQRDYRQLALHQLAIIESQSLAAQPLAAAVNGLLKRVTLSQQPKGAGLSGLAWIEFLNRQCPEPLSPQCTLLLCQQAYALQPLLSAEQLAQAMAEVRHWLHYHRWESKHADP